MTLYEFDLAKSLDTLFKLAQKCFKLLRSTLSNTALSKLKFPRNLGFCTSFLKISDKMDCHRWMLCKNNEEYFF